MTIIQSLIRTELRQCLYAGFVLLPLATLPFTATADVDLAGSRLDPRSPSHTPSFISASADKISEIASGANATSDQPPVSKAGSADTGSNLDQLASEASWNVQVAGLLRSAIVEAESGARGQRSSLHSIN